MYSCSRKITTIIIGGLQKVFGVGHICNVLYMYMYMVVGSFYILHTCMNVTKFLPGP